MHDTTLIACSGSGRMMLAPTLKCTLPFSMRIHEPIHLRLCNPDTGWEDVAKNSALLSGLPPKSATQPLAPNSVPHVTQSHVGLPPRSQSAAPQGLPRTPSGWYDHTHNSAPGLVQWARSPEVGRVACIMHSICVELAAPSHDGPYCCLNQYS
eukprot:scaffold73000_cov21-Tisochrysis_lutea.AAC.2